MSGAGGGGGGGAGINYSGLGGDISDIFSGIGQLEAASSYGEAARYAEKNAAITKQSTGIQELQAARQTYQALGTTQADIAGSGFAASGTALNLMRSNAQQASLSKQLIANQGLITEQGYEEAASQYKGEQSASEMSGIGSIAGGVLGIFGSV